MDGIYNSEDGLFVGDSDTGKKLAICLNSESMNCMMVSLEIAVVACDGGYMLLEMMCRMQQVTALNSIGWIEMPLYVCRNENCLNF